MQNEPCEDPKALGHEPIGTNVRAVWWTGAGLGVVVVVSFLVVAGMMKLFAGEDVAIREPTGAQPPMSPGIPVLNPDQPLELLHLRESEQKWLSSYGWIEKADGLARIPVDRAMQIVAADGLPQWSPPKSQDEGTEESPAEGSDP